MSEKLTENRFRGLVATENPEALGPGEMAELLNAMVVSGNGGQGGLLRTRPGKRALLSSALAGKITRAYLIAQANGSQSLLLAVADVSSTTGYIWRYDQGGTSATRIDALGTFNVWLVSFATVGGWVFIAGNIDGITRRTDLTVFETATGLLTPTAAPTTSLTSLMIGGVGSNAATTWHADALATGTVPDVAVISSAHSHGGWTGSGWNETGTVETKSGTSAPAWVRLDDPPSYLTSDPIVNLHLVNSCDTYATRYSLHFEATADYDTDTGGAADAVTLSVLVYKAYTNTGGTITVDDSDLVQTLTKTWTPGIVDAPLTLRSILSFAGLDDTLAKAYVVRIGAGANNRSGSNGPYLYSVSVKPYIAPSTFAASSGSDRVDVMVAV